jgi:hypothetical protein
MQLIIISRALVSVDAQEIMYVYICIAIHNFLGIYGYQRSRYDNQLHQVTPISLAVCGS